MVTTQVMTQSNCTENEYCVQTDIIMEYITRLELMLMAWVKEVDELKNQLMERNEENNKLKNELIEWDEEICWLRNEYVEQGEEIDWLRKQYTTLCDENIELKDSVKKLLWMRS